MTQDLVPFGELTKSLAARFEVTPEEFLATVKAQCFKNGAATTGQLLMLLSFAKQYDLNPLAKECYAFVSSGQMSVGVQSDGWSKIANRESSYDGQEFKYERDENGNLIAIVCRTYVKSRRYPTEYRAVMKEWHRAGSAVWQSMPEHQLWLKARNESIRFSFGIPAYDGDDIERLQESTVIKGWHRQASNETEPITSITLNESGVTQKQTEHDDSAIAGNGSGKMGLAKNVAAINDSKSITSDQSDLKNSESVSLPMDQQSEASNLPNAKSFVTPATSPKLSENVSADTITEPPTPTGDLNADAPNVLTDNESIGAQRSENIERRKRARPHKDKRAHLDHLVAQKVTAARLNLMKAQAGVVEIEELSDQQVNEWINRLEK